VKEIDPPRPSISRPNRPGMELNHPIPGTPGITPGIGVMSGNGMGGTPPIPQGANMSSANPKMRSRLSLKLTGSERERSVKG